jgi:prophage regulatory protein
MSDRLLTWAQLSNVIPYSRDHIRRLEDAGEFPARLQLGRGRVAWRESEVDAWIDSRKRGPITVCREPRAQTA